MRCDWRENNITGCNGALAHATRNWCPGLKQLFVHVVAMYDIVELKMCAGDGIERRNAPSANFLKRSTPRIQFVEHVLDLLAW